MAFVGNAAGATVRCAVSREALDDHFGAQGLSQAGRLEKFREHRAEIESCLQAKYLSSPIEEAGAVLLRTMDVEGLKHGS